MADAQFRQVGHQLGGLGEGEVAVELQAVGGARDDGGQRRGRRRLARPHAAAALGPQGAGQRLPARLVGPGRQPQRQLASPVGVAVGAAGQVVLFEQAEHVLRLHRQHPARCAGKKRVHGHAQLRAKIRHGLRVDAGAGRQQLLVFECRQQPGALASALGHGLFARRRRREQAQFVPQAQVVPGPVAAQGRQVVGAHGRQRGLRVVRRRPEAAVGVVFEHQWPVAQHAGSGQRRAQGVRHRAQVLADHQALVALAFQCQDAQQVAERIGHVGAIGGAGSGGHPPQAHQAHDVVDAQRAAVAHGGAQGLDERRVGQFAQLARHERRQAPVLAVRVEVVRRRAGVCAGRVHVTPSPGVGAARTHADGQVLVQADAETALPGFGPRGGQLLVSQPLQVGMERHRVGVFAGETARRLPAGVVVFRRPGRPAPHRRVGGVEVRLQCLEQRVPVQPFAAAGPKPLEGGRPRAVAAQVLVAEGVPGLPQHVELDRGHARVVDQLGVAQLLQACLEARVRHLGTHGASIVGVDDGVDVQVQHVQKLPARRAVRAALVGLVRKQRVQRIDADQAATCLGGERDQCAQVGEVADAPVTRGAQAVQLHGGPPQATGVAHRLGLKAGGGNPDQV